MKKNIYLLFVVFFCFVSCSKKGIEQYTGLWYQYDENNGVNKLICFYVYKYGDDLKYVFKNMDMIDKGIIKVENNEQILVSETGTIYTLSDRESIDKYSDNGIVISIEDINSIIISTLQRESILHELLLEDEIHQMQAYSNNK